MADSVQKHCQACSKTYNFFNKKYPCKGCNKHFCSECTSTNHSFPEFGIFQTTKICAPCVKRFTSLKSAKTPTPSALTTKSGGMPDNNSIDSMLESLMEELQLKTGARQTMRALDLAQKWLLITSHSQEVSSQDKQKNDPNYWVDILKSKGSNISHSELKTLLVTLRGQTKTWILQFMSGNGMALILEIVHSSKNVETKLAALQCTTALLDTDVGLRQFLQLPAAMGPMAMMCKTEEDAIKVEILGMLSFVATADLEEGYPLVYESLTQPTLGRRPFEFLVELLSESRFHNVKYEVMVLINALINAPDHLEDRNHTRDQFIQADILKAIAKIRDIIATQLLEGTAAAYSVVPLHDMSASLTSPSAGAASPQRKATLGAPPPPSNNTHNPGQGMAISHVLEQLFVQCDLFESAMTEDKSESTRNGLDYSDMVSLQTYLRTEIAPRFPDYVLPIHQLLVAAPTNRTQGQLIWSTLLAVLRRLLGQAENPDPSDVHYYYSPVSFEEIFALVDRSMFEAGQIPKSANVDKAYNQELEQQRAELSQTMLRLTAAQEETKKHKDVIEKMRAEAIALRSALDQANSIPPPPSDPSLPGPPPSDPESEAKMIAMNKEIEQLRSQLAAAKAAPPVAVAPVVAAPVVQSGPCPKCAAGDAGAAPAQAGPVIDYSIPACPDLFDEGLPTGPAVGVAQPAGTVGVVAPPTGATPAATSAPAPAVSDIPICPDLFDEGLPVASAAAAPISGSPSGPNDGVPPCPDLFDEGLPTAGGAAPAAGGAATNDGIPHCPDLFDEGLPTNAAKSAGAPAAAVARAAPVAAKPVEPKPIMPYTKKVVKPAVKMRAIHWAKVDDKLINESIWKDINDTKIKIDHKELEAIFCQSLPRAAEDKKEEEAGVARKATQAVQTVQFVEGQRQQNIAIAISRFKPLTNEQIRDAILNLDDKALPLEKVSSILKWLPAPEELEAIASYEGPPAALGNVEKYFAAIGQIPRLERRLEVFQFKLQSDIMFEEVSTRINTCLMALQAISSSKRIKNMLEYVLALGNFFNAGSNKGEAYGFKLQYLSKLSNTKTADNKSNLLNYLITLIDKDPENVGNFTDDIASCPEASRIELPSLQADVAKITVGIRKAENEVKSSKDPNDRFSKILTKFLEKASPVATSIASNLEKLTTLSTDLAKKFGEDPSQFGPDAIFSLFADVFNQVKAARTAMDKASKDKERQDRLAAANAARAKMNPGKKPVEGEDDGPAAPIGPGALRKTQTSTPGSPPPQVSVNQNDLAAVFARRQQQKLEVTPPESGEKSMEPPSPSATLRTQVDSALRGNDSADILKEINARRAARGNAGTRRLFGNSVVQM